MYWKFLLKRVLNGILMYMLLILVYSAIFDTTMRTTIESQIRDTVNAEVLRMTQTMKPEEVQQFIATRYAHYNRIYHLDTPTFNRITLRAWDTLTLKFGKSTIIKSAAGERDVFKIVSEAIPRTLMLFGIAIIIDIIIGVLLGLKKAQKAGGVLDKSTSIGTMVVYGMPSWWLGMLAIMFFAYTFKIFPSGGIYSVPPPTGGFASFMDLLYHLTLPVLTLVVLGFWGRAYLTRNIVLGTLQEDFIMSARARGIPERKVLYGHTMRTAAPPIVTMALLALLASVSGNILFEGIFSWPGMGNLYWVAIQQNDIPVLMGNLAVTTALYIGGLVLLDLIYGFLDPRIKVGGKA